MEIRIATLADIDILCDILGHEMAPEFDFCATDWDKGSREIRHVLENGQIILAMDDETIAGTIGLLEHDYFWWSSDRFITDQWVFVRPQYRQSRVFIMMMKYLGIVAKHSKIPIILSISSPRDVEIKQRLFGRYGKRVGNYFHIQEAI